MNDLEDAYINIAKQEEKILSKLKKPSKKGPQRSKISKPDENQNLLEQDKVFGEEDMLRYQNAKTSSNGVYQAFTNFKRRLVSFRRQPR